jgi:L-aminopeptidase/D-esterase-like protein
VTEPLAGVRVGHWTDPGARTGCTVVMLPAGAVASGEVRGGAPGTREWALLEPWRTVGAVNAVVLSGGSAFGLAAGDGVARWCEEQGIGYPTPAGPVPIVVGAVLYDLDIGDRRRRPGPDDGYAACVSAEPWPGPGLRAVPGEWVACPGAVGAATGATVARYLGTAGRRPGALGVAQAVAGDLVVGALAAVNALGDVRRPGAGAGDRVVPGGGGSGGGLVAPGGGDGGGLQATTIGVVVTNARLDKLGCYLVAQSAHDGLARALDPVHTSGDGDAFVAAALGGLEAATDRVRVLAAAAVEAAVRAGAGG